jgi:uncharacterized membrane protein YphA (DoxX/SURF4 family)
MVKANKKTANLTDLQFTMLVLLRFVVGWHFLYEGIAKMLNENWTAAAYLQNSKWIFSNLFQWIASNQVALNIVDLLNIWGLTLIGLSLLLGLFTRLSSILGIVLLSLYYVANPPFIGTGFGIPLEGYYLFVNKIVIEIVALAIVAVFPTDLSLSLERLNNIIKRKKEESLKKAVENENAGMSQKNLRRREALKFFATFPILGTFAYGTVKKYNWEKVNTITGATIKVSDSKLSDLQEGLPKGKIKDKVISRIFMGGNLIGGWSHSRDLIYVSSLFKAYNTEKKVFETLSLGEKAGMNTINCTGGQMPLINKYKRIFNSNLQTMCQIHPTKEETFGPVNEAIDNGVDIIQIQGNCCDWRVRDGEIDVLAKCIDHIKSQKYVAGLGAHSVQALIECNKYGIVPDFYMKTLHHDQYWSAHPRENRVPFEVDTERHLDHNKFHDNMFCLFPEETIEFVNSTDIPFVGFKVLAGGAIHPEDGFRFAFENGADFICVGMFDWQVVDNVNTTLKVLSSLERKREWYA